MPRGAGGIRSRWNFPNELLSSAIARSPLKAWMRTPGWLSTYKMNVRPFFVGKAVLRSMSFVMTSPAVSKPTDKGATSNTSHTAPGSLPASPLSSRSSPPQFQVVIRRTHDFSGASGHSTHRCGCCCYCGCCGCCCCCCETWRIMWKVASLLFLFFPASSLSTFFQSLSLFPAGLPDPVSIADLFGRLPGCSPGSAPSPGAAHVWPVVNTDPPCVVPPCHVSVQHVALIMH